MTGTSNAWKSHYGALAKELGCDLDRNAAYSKMLEISISAQACAIQLNQTTDLCGIAAQGSGKIHLVHQFQYDMAQPMNPQGTDQLWTLVGSEAHAGVMTVPATAFATVEALVPEWSDLAAAGDKAILVALQPSAATTTNPKLNTRRITIIPPFLAKALMDTGLDDAAELCIWTIKALSDFDTARTATSPGAAAAAPTATAAGATAAAVPAPPAGPSATSTFRDLAYFLWLVATKTVKSADLTMNMSSTRATAWISGNQARIFGAQAVPGNSGFAPPGGLPPLAPGGTNNAALTTTLSNLDGTLGKLATETELARTSKERANSDKNRALTRFGNLPSWTKTMILRASEKPPADATDDNGDLLTWRIVPVETYTDVLKVTTVGSCKLYLDHLLNDVMKCATNIPMSTCQAIHTGTLRWSNPDFPQAFSLFACPYAGAMLHGAVLDQEAQELLLKATEGKGLSDSDVQKATKILLYAPSDIDIAARMIGVYACLLECMFGANSPVVLAANGWIPHIRANQLAYDHLTRADALFPTKVCWLIDKSIQLYLGQCANATKHSLVSEGIICFDAAQQQIVLGTFTMHGVPPILSKQILRARMPPGPGAQNHWGEARSDWGEPWGPNPPPGGARQHGAGKRSNNGSPQDQPRGRPISNPDHPAKWKITDSREYGYFLKKLRDAPMCWGPGIPACGNYWIRGVCRANCPREASHQPLVGACRIKFNSFVLKTREDYQSEETP
jgi:hypothetical protein